MHLRYSSAIALVVASWLALEVVEAAAFAEGSACPKGPVIRKEWRTMSKEEQNTFLDAIVKLQNPGGSGKTYQFFFDLYRKGRKNFYGMPLSLPWNRYFLAQFEANLFTVTGKQIAVPYWAFEQDWENPAAAPVFDDTTFGKNGDKSKAVTATVVDQETPKFFACVTTGKFANFKLDFNGTPGCVSREWDKPTAPKGWNGTPLIDMIFANYRSYDNFRQRWEMAVGTVRMAMNGVHRTEFAFADPLTLLLMANYDRYYLKWQQLKPANLRLFDGTGPDGKPVDASAPMTDFTPAVPPSDVFNISKLCYKYDDSTADQTTSGSNSGAGGGTSSATNTAGSSTTGNAATSGSTGSGSTTGSAGTASNNNQSGSSNGAGGTGSTTIASGQGTSGQSTTSSGGASSSTTGTGKKGDDDEDKDKPPVQTESTSVSYHIAKKLVKSGYWTIDAAGNIVEIVVKAANVPVGLKA